MTQTQQDSKAKKVAGDRAWIASKFLSDDTYSPTYNVAEAIACGAASGILLPLEWVKAWLSQQAEDVLRRNLTPTQWDEYWAYAKIASDLDTCISIGDIRVAALVGQSLPTKLASFDDMLEEALTAAGLGSEAAADALVHDVVEIQLEELREIPGFKEEWLTQRGSRNIPQNWRTKPGAA